MHTLAVKGTMSSAWFLS